MVSRVVLIFVVAGLAGTAGAQSASPPPNEAPSLPIQRVGADDLISLSVTNSPELTRNFRVSADGTLTLPMLKQKIAVGGKDTPEIEKEISDELVSEQILVQPVVSVSVAEYRSRPVSVLGAVRHPITFQAMGDTTLLDALAKADGLAPEAGADILITHPHSVIDGYSASLLQRIPVKQLLNEADPAQNIRLYGGEEIRVPSAGRVYVLGNVKHSGAFQIQDNDQLTVLKLLAQSEGLSPFARKQAYIFRKEAGKADRDEIAVPLREILQRKSPDVTLQANDILYVPEDGRKRITVQTLDKMANFGVGTASGFLVFH